MVFRKRPEHHGVKWVTNDKKIALREPLTSGRPLSRFDGDCDDPVVPTSIAILRLWNKLKHFAY